MSENLEIIKKLVAAIKTKDFDTYASYFAEDAT